MRSLPKYQRGHLIDARTLCQVFLWCLLLGSPTSSSPVINASSVLTPLGENATFVCTNFQSDLASFIIMDEVGGTQLVVVEDDDQVELRRRNIFESKSAGEIVLDVLANEMNNNSRVKCRDLQLTPLFSMTFNVTVIGPPLSPAVMSTVVNATLLVLNWEEPFTWPGHNITHYDITQHVSGEPQHSNTTQLSHMYLSPSGETPTECQNVTFMVSAVSDLGASEPDVLDTGLPKSLGTFGTVNPEVRFTKSGDPEVTVTLEPPPLCVYQTAEIVLKLVDENGGVLSEMKRTYMGQPQELSVFFPMHLIPNANYTLMLAVSTVAGNASKNVVFDTQQPKSFSVPISVIVGVAGALVVIVIVITIIVFCCATARYRSKLARSSRGTASGCQRDSTYEYIEDYHVVPSPRKNNYFASHPIPLSQLQQPRSESPYQDMSSAKAAPSPSHTKTFELLHGADQPSPAAPEVPNNDMLVTPGGSVVYRSRGSANSSTEDDYAVMQSPGQQRDQLARCSVTLPENALSYNGQPDGKYTFTEC